jgi:hypothetical protein
MGVEMLHMVCTCGDGEDMVLLITCNENTTCIHQNLYHHLSAHSKTFETCKVLVLANTW